MARDLRAGHREAHVARTARARGARGCAARSPRTARPEPPRPRRGRAHRLAWPAVPLHMGDCARMKAIRIHEDGGPEVLRYEDAPDPEPGPGEVLVRLRAASLNHLDLWIRKGLPSVPKPRILGADGAGFREDTGERVVINPGIEHGEQHHRGRRAHGRHARGAGRRAGDERLPAPGRALVRGGRRLPARLRDRLPAAGDEGTAARGRVGAALGDRQRRRHRRASRSRRRSARGRSSPRPATRSSSGRASSAPTRPSTTRAATSARRSRRRPRARASRSCSSTSARRPGRPRCRRRARAAGSSSAARPAARTRRPPCTGSGGSS